MFDENQLWAGFDVKSDGKDELAAYVGPPQTSLNGGSLWAGNCASHTCPEGHYCVDTDRGPLCVRNGLAFIGYDDKGVPTFTAGPRTSPTLPNPPLSTGGTPATIPQTVTPTSKSADDSASIFGLNPLLVLAIAAGGIFILSQMGGNEKVVIGGK